MALKVFTKLNAILGFDSRVGEFGYHFEVDVLGATARLGYAEGYPGAQLFLGSIRTGNLVADAKSAHVAQGIFVAQMQKLVGTLNCGQAAVMGRVGRAPWRPLYNFAMRGGGAVDPRTRWALGCSIRVAPHIAPRPTGPAGKRSMFEFVQKRAQMRQAWKPSRC